MKSTLKTISENRTKWVAALRSGKYNQGRGALAEPRNGGFEYCCLGVAREVCDLPRSPDPFSYFILSQDTLDLLGLDRHSQRALVDLNDDRRLPFEQIADFIDTLPVAQEAP